MKHQTDLIHRLARFRMFSRKAFAIFSSLKREVSIGVLSTIMLSLPCLQVIQAEIHSVPLKGAEIEEIEITGSLAPLTLNEAARVVIVITQQEIQAAAAQSVNELLKQVAGVDVRQRGDKGIQTDISIRGGTFDQITLLLNGVNMNSPQTGHHSADFPINLSDIERIEILEAPAARIYGTSAFTGAINIVTFSHPSKQATAQLTAGSNALLGAESTLSFPHKRFKNQLSIGYNRSDGYAENSDFEQKRAFYQTSYQSPHGTIFGQFGVSDKGFGANTFYSPAYPNQFEQLRRYMGSIRLQTKGKIRFLPSLYWNRIDDRFELFRSNPPTWYTNPNYHQTTVYGINLNAYYLSKFGKTAVGAEMRAERVLSNVLGEELEKPIQIPNEGTNVFTKQARRTAFNYYGEHTLFFSKFTVSLGVLATHNTGLDSKVRFYPGIDASFRINQEFKLYGSYNQSLRMPTFTDLYYTGPNNIGNAALKPERATSFEIGIKQSNTVVQTSLSFFVRAGKEMIDWVKYAENDRWRTVNHTQLTNSGFELNGYFNGSKLWGKSTFLERITCGYAYIHQTKSSGQVYKSNYALDYLRHKFATQVTHKISPNLFGSWAFRWQDRMGSYTHYVDLKPATEVVYPAYGVIDAKIQWKLPRITLFCEANNLFNVRYYDLGDVAQPGFWGKIGVSWQLF